MYGTRTEKLRIVFAVYQEIQRKSPALGPGLPGTTLEFDTPSLAEPQTQAKGKIEAAYWFRVPDDLPWLLSQAPAVMRVYLAIVHSCQRDRNPGVLSERELSRRAGVRGIHHVVEARDKLLGDGKIEADLHHGRTTKYRLPHGWQGGNWSPTGDQLGSDGQRNWSPTGDQSKRPKKRNWSPTGDLNWSPLGDQTLEFLESSSNSLPSRSFEGGKKSDDDPPKLPRTGTETPEQEFRLRLAERHRGRNDGEEICRVVREELDKGGATLEEFLAHDAAKTTAPAKLTNPGGHYRKLARQLARSRKDETATKTIAQGVAIQRAKATTATATPERCGKCQHGRIGEGFCSCSLGQDLAKVEARAKEVA